MGELLVLDYQAEMKIPTKFKQSAAEIIVVQYIPYIIVIGMNIKIALTQPSLDSLKIA